MNRLIVAAALAASVCLPATAGSSQAFHADSLAAITSRLCGKGPLAVAFWSLDCAHCKEGLAALDKLRKQRRNLTLVLVQADAEDQADEGARRLKHFGIGGSERWIFADELHERVRYAVDPAWRGELPRSYLYGPDCQREAATGTLKAAQLQAWLARFR